MAKPEVWPDWRVVSGGVALGRGLFLAPSSATLFPLSFCAAYILLPEVLPHLSPTAREAADHELKPPKLCAETDTFSLKLRDPATETSLIQSLWCQKLYPNDTGFLFFCPLSLTTE